MHYILDISASTVLLCVGVKDQLNKAKQHAEQYKSIAESMEKSMTEQNKVSLLHTNRFVTIVTSV